MKTGFKQETIFGIDKELFGYFLVPFFVFIIILILSGKIIIPKIEEINQIKVDISKTEIEVEALTEKISFVKNETDSDFSQREGLLSGTVLKDLDVYYLMNVVDSLASENGFAIDSFDLTIGDIGMGGAENGGVVPIEVDLVGPRTDYVKMIKAIENSLPVLVINDLDIKSGGEIVHIIARLQSYFYNIDQKKVNIQKTVLADLKNSASDIKVLDQLAGYKQFTMIQSSQVEFVTQKYELRNPFSLSF